MRNTKQKQEPDQEGKKPPVDSEFGEILSTEVVPKESEQSAAVAQEENDKGTMSSAGNDEGSDGQDAAVADDTSATAVVSNEDRPVEVAPSARTGGDSPGNDDNVSEEAGADDNENDNDDDGDVGGDSGNDDTVSEEAGADDNENDNDDDDDVETEAKDDEDTSVEVTKGEKEKDQNIGEAVSKGNESGVSAEAPDKATKTYANVLRGPHKKTNEELDKLRGSHVRDKSTGALPVDDEKAESASAKERAKGQGSPELDSEQPKNFGPPASSSSPPKGRQHHSSSPAHCSMLSLPCHTKAAFSAHPVSFVLVSATFVLLIIRRIRRKSRNNANARMDGRGEYAAIELLEGNFDDEMSFTGDIDDEDADDIINSWRGDAGNSHIASGVGDDLDDVADGELSLSELNG